MQSHNTESLLPTEEIVCGPIAKWAAKRPDHPAIITPSGLIISYKDLTGIISSWICVLSLQEIENNSRIAVVLPNGADMAAAFLGVTAIATCVPLNPSYSQEEFSYYLHDTKCSAVLVSGGFPTSAESAADDLGIPHFHLRSTNEIISGFSPVIQRNVWIDEKVSTVFPRTRPEDIALVLHTSGTTGKPKRVPLRQDRICRNAVTIAESLSLNPDDRCLNLMPLFHVHGLIGCLLATLYSGGTIITAPGFQPDRITTWLEDLEPTWYSAVPAIHHAVLRVLPKEGDLRHCLRFIRSCSAPLPPTLFHDLEERFKIPVIEAYGMTEAAHQIASNPLPPALHIPGSVGIPTGYSISIRDFMNRELNRDERGEVWISGKNLFSGYEENPDANGEDFREGFFRTGDEGFMDQEGYLYLTGRSKELINKGGEKVAPREIEEVFFGFPGVEQAVAFAFPHPELGEDIGLILVPSPGYKPGMGELRQYALRHLAPWKVPSQIRIMKDIPKGPTGKVQRREIAKMMTSDFHDSVAAIPVTEENDSSGLEDQIRRIWEKVLQREVIGLDEDFFAIGGYSLTALAITTELEKSFEINLPPTILFDTPTIRDLAAMIRKIQSGEPLSYLVTFNMNGDRTPLFLVPPMRGNAFYYKEFSTLLGPSQPFYSFSWLQKKNSPETIEDLAEKYVKEIQRVLPSGPILVGGYCVGALIALEMVHILQDHGRDVRCLVVIDPENPQNGPDWTWEPTHQTRQEWLVWLIRGGPVLWYRFAIAFINNRVRKCSISKEEQEQREIIISHINMIKAYRARVYTGCALAVHHAHATEILKQRWEMLLGDSAKTLIIPGTTHHEVLHHGGNQVADFIKDISASTDR